MDLRSRYGSWALVTGASAGLGECFARELGRQGMNLILVARRAERLERLAADLRRECRIEAIPVAADLTEEEGLQALIRAAAEHEVGLLVNNAGFGWSGAFVEQTDESIRRMVRLNCEAPARIARALLPNMVRQSRGAMILIASVAGHMPTPWISLYGASKAFDLHLGEGLAVELRSSGVDVLTVSPGHTRTEFHGAAGVSGSTIGGSAKPEDVVLDALLALGRKELRVHRALNRLLCWIPRITTRRAMASLSGAMLARRLRRTHAEREA
ncbi:MAG: SDR family oxidoreductase [Planctomycetota bacterium]|nr:SDR family oxidoreductase [Planctomycetota bacterium]